MPTGNHHHFPSGFWFFGANQSTVPQLLARTCGRVVLFGIGLQLYWMYRVDCHDNVLNSFNGRCLSLGTHTTATHEPLSVEEIDRLKEEMYARKKVELGIL